MPVLLRRDSLLWSYDVCDMLPTADLQGINIMHFDGTVLYIELRYYHTHLVKTAGFGRRRNDWIRTHIQKLITAGIPDHHCTRASKLDGHVNFDTVSLLGFISILFMHVNAGNSGSASVAKCVTRTIHAIATLCGQQITCQSHHHRPPYVITVRHRALHVTLSVDRRTGMVDNWSDVMAVVPGAYELWELCRLDPCERILTPAPYKPSFLEIIAFVACGLQRLPVSGGSHAAMLSICNALMQHMTSLFQTCIIHAATQTVAAPRPPVLRHGYRASLVDPITARSLLDRARSLGTVPREVLRFNSDRPEYAGLSHGVADRWFLRELCMYRRNIQDVFTGVRQFSISADPSGYNGEDTLVSLVYSVCTKTSAPLIIKTIPRCKHIALDELEMTDRFAAVTIARKQKRWAAFT